MDTILNNRTVAYCTLGCKVNQYDTDTMRSLLENAGCATVEFNETADIYVINTCAVTHVSERKSRQMIGRARRLNPSALVVICGCYSQTAKSDISVASVDDNMRTLILGTNDRGRIVEAVKSKLTDSLVSESNSEFTEFEDLSTLSGEHTRAVLKIQDGCNRFCSYCIIPYARGRIRSRALSSIEREFANLSAAGYKEVVLTGIHLMSFGADFNNGIDLTDAIACADNVRSIKRIRLGSLEPAFINDKFVDYISGNPRICQQFHLSLQSGSSTVLARMNRHYTPQEYAAAVSKLREKMPECAFTTDIIVGFPGETDYEFQETLDFVREIGFARIHVFPYSKRHGTPAAKMPNQVREELKNIRCAQLIELASVKHDEFISRYIGRTIEILLEERVGDYCRGYSGNYIDVHVPVSELDENVLSYMSDKGVFLTVVIKSACNGALIGSIINH